MAAEKFKRKLKAILSADVKGYSRLMGEDEEGTIRTLDAWKEVITGQIQHHRGRVVGSAGDSVLAEFGRGGGNPHIRNGLRSSQEKVGLAPAPPPPVEVDYKEKRGRGKIYAG